MDETRTIWFVGLSNLVDALPEKRWEVGTGVESNRGPFSLWGSGVGLNTEGSTVSDSEDDVPGTRPDTPGRQDGGPRSCRYGLLCTYGTIVGEGITPLVPPPSEILVLTPGLPRF